MLDTFQPPEPCTPANWRDRLAPGDIVVFRAPLAGQPASARPQPCLVLDVEILRGRRCALLAPGMPSFGAAATGPRVVVDRRTDRRAAGLERATRFCLRARLLVPLEHVGFVASEGTGTPVLGRLVGAAVDRLQAERARIHALRDIRAGDAQPGGHWRGALRGRDFSVERRNILRPLPLASMAPGRSDR